MIDFTSQRKALVDSQLRPNGITDHRILAAIAKVPRELYVPAGNRSFAYRDGDVALTGPQAPMPRALMSAMVFARLLQRAEVTPESRVLVIGAGTGYSCAIIAEMAQSVVGLEENAELVAQAPVLPENATLISGPHAAGYKAEAPYDVIIIEGRAEEIGDALFEQLLDEGRIATVLGAPLKARISVCTMSEGARACASYQDAAAVLVPGFVRQIPSFSF